MLIDDIRVLGAAVYDVIQEDLLHVNLSTVIQDLSRVNDTLESQLQEGLEVSPAA